MIRIRGLTKYFGTHLVLDRVDLDVERHEVVCLIGASGSGKSTLLRCINRLIEPDYGEIALDGVSVSDASFGKTGLQRRVGIVFQSYNLFPHMRVIDNVTLAPRKVQRLARAAAEARALEVLALLGMESFAYAYPEQLSGGQQQRVALARALAGQPDVLLLDEVTAALDPELVGEVMAAIRGLKARGLTMVIVTHEMGFARGLADRVCFLDGGRIIEEAPPEQLFAAPEHPRTQAFLHRLLEAGRL
ncbi:amino acid ABC transporter ATP-binding protein [Pararhodobacter zhoushanensis]|uniref:Amino acid ABC transporter ATP-binding protein n=1 Tax=Pararhodobacter zhoushanensis TaxID=2479545 RepID=A0ABT3GXI1_9RHOB|nr:amino acid ABC transporter ATP-binding protein [Pararhodobacter zhoushanensis]MCW1932200.1 amino acid ABC transporter ATP-binding protein [Pararhodobacter zhoushanensis]